MRNTLTHPALKGGLLALLAAALFGLSTPMVQSLGQGVGAFTTAALLYAGAAVVAWVLRRPAAQEAKIQLQDWPRLLAMAGTGAVIGPVALAWGLQHTSGSSASLMLTLEALFTAVLAWRWYGETLDKRVVLAVLLLFAGGVILVIEQSALGQKRHELSENKLALVHCGPLRANAKDHKSWNRSSNRDQTEMMKNQGKSLTYEALMSKRWDTTDRQYWVTGSRPVAYQIH